ncbi:activator of 90 kDa heat shock protein ATPase homolog 1-like [Ptychodera flava]|uniref:activator of 90 kDa heat shock protein ATPase homolog 1-like n=1 Tax=Ptychodera flava TaxID=63121 RepID=UPI00396A7C67
MAKWGEGDPRWIVEERADATNVNNWHWTEKNATAWSKDKLKELLLDLKVENEKGCCKITEIAKCEGEATASNRKAKLIFFYEWDIKLEWKGTLTDCDTELTGNVEIPNLSDENDVDDLTFNVTVKKDTEESRILKEIMRKMGVDVLKKQCGMYIKSLREEFSQGMILPTKGESGATVKENAKKTTQTQKKNGVIPQTKETKNLKLGVKIPTSNITSQQEFKCRACELYEVLTDVQRVQAFMRSKAEMDVEPEGRFTLLDGNISGQFIELVPNVRIVQRWRFKSWPDEHYSTVTLELEEKSDHTQLNLEQIGVPNNELDRTKEGWERYYWQSIKTTFGFGSSLF